MLESLVRSKTARKILVLLFLNPDERFYIRQLERLAEEPVSAVRRELEKLEKSGLLLSKDEAKVKYYWVNKQNPIYEELKKIILKTQAIGSTLKNLVKKIPDIKIAFIYGSVAKGNESAVSDIDLMIIGSIDTMKIHLKISEIEDKIKRTINYTLIKEKEFRSKKTDFLRRVLKEKKIFLVGSENELQKFT